MISKQELNSLVLNAWQVRPVLADLVAREIAMYRETSITHGEYLLPNLWVNRNTGSRAYYELSWHDGHNYHMLSTKFEDIGQKIDEEEFYNVYTIAMCSALLDPTVPFNLTMCQLEA